jgi:hypothetical protein
MLNMTGSISPETDMDLLDMLQLAQSQKDIMAMLQRYESHQMTPLEEISFFQYLINTGIVWAMPSKYIKHAEEMIEKKFIYYN